MIFTSESTIRMSVAGQIRAAEVEFPKRGKKKRDRREETCGVDRWYVAGIQAKELHPESARSFDRVIGSRRANCLARKYIAFSWCELQGGSL